VLEAIKDARGPIETPIRASRVAWFGVWRGAIRGKAKRPRGSDRSQSRAPSGSGISGDLVVPQDLP
jgi:hypothetical protein